MSATGGGPSFRLGIVGLGHFGRTMTARFREHEGVEIVAVCDPSAAAVQSVTSDTGALGYRDHEDLLGDAGRLALDGIYVSSPPSTHLPVVLAAHRAGVHVLCEKPLAPDAVESGEILRSARASAPLVTAVHFPLQYAGVGPGWRQLHADGRLGRLRRVELRIRCPRWPRPIQDVGWVATRRQGGPVLEVATHLVQLVRSVLGELTVVESRVEWPADPERCELSAHARLVTDDGVPVDLIAETAVAGDEIVTVVADGELASVAMLEWETLVVGAPGEPFAPASGSARRSVLTEFVAATRGDDALVIDAADAHATQRIIDRIRGIASPEAADEELS